jgi:hypothetical protein
MLLGCGHLNGLEGVAPSKPCPHVMAVWRGVHGSKPTVCEAWMFQLLVIPNAM